MNPRNYFFLPVFTQDKKNKNWSFSLNFSETHKNFFYFFTTWFEKKNNYKKRFYSVSHIFFHVFQRWKKIITELIKIILFSRLLQSPPRDKTILIKKYIKVLHWAYRNDIFPYFYRNGFLRILSCCILFTFYGVIVT